MDCRASLAMTGLCGVGVWVVRDSEVLNARKSKGFSGFDGLPRFARNDEPWRFENAKQCKGFDVFLCFARVTKKSGLGSKGFGGTECP
ncbi:MAG: hypothetical protein FWD01_02715 [Defluviitaleaceae bacterium]|nr:hypothetical protein [Defluviitaleaceae bacterium]